MHLSFLLLHFDPFAYPRLSGRHRQRRDPPHHASKQPPRQMTLGHLGRT